MSGDHIILCGAWIATIISLILFVPKDKIRQALLIFLFKQTLTWLLGLIVAEFGLIEYPERLLGNATKADFTFEFFIYPSICVLFNLHYPEQKSRLRRFMHFVYYTSAITAVEVLCEKYTDIIKYIHWNWYFTWISLLITFYISRRFYVWFFRLKENKA